MIVQIITASKHGSTREIGQTITDILREAGIDARLIDIEEVDGLESIEAVILGSAIYVGNWMGQAREFIDRHTGELTARPVWLFSSGPIGTPEDNPEPIDAAKIQELIDKTGAREHVVFGGSLDRSKLSLGERLITKVVHAPEGDYRNWDAIQVWARHIASELRG